MGKFGKFSGKMMTAVLAAAMLCQSAAMAAPLDELNEIMEKQAETAEESLLEQQLGLSALVEAMEENGLQIQVRAELLPQTAETLDLEGGFWEDGYVTLNTQFDPNLKKWLLEAEAGSAETALLDLGLYGDSAQLALSAPQFFAGALALKAGNLKEQYLSSELAQILGQFDEMPDIELNFFPEEIDSPFSDFEEELEARGQELAENMQVDKTEEGDLTVYTAAVETGDIMEFYRLFFDEYISLFTNNGLLTFTNNDLQDLDADLDQMLDELESMLGEEIAVRFEVKDDLVERISYEIYVDTTALEESEEETVLTEVVTETLAPAGNAEDAGVAENAADGEADTLDIDTVIEEMAAKEASAMTEGAAAGGVTSTDEDVDVSADADFETNDAIVQADDFQGYVAYELEYADPADPDQGFDINVQNSDADRQEMGTMLMSYSSRTDGTAKEITFAMDFAMEGETLYSGTPFRMSFDSADNTLEAEISFTDSDTGEEAVEKLISSFDEIEKGKSFVWNIDELSVTVNGETVGLGAEVQVSAEPGEIAEPQEVRTFLEMTQGQLLDLVNEISANAEVWSAQFETGDSADGTDEEIVWEDDEAVWEDGESEGA